MFCCSFARSYQYSMMSTRAAVRAISSSSEPRRSLPGRTQRRRRAVEQRRRRPTTTTAVGSRSWWTADDAACREGCSPRPVATSGRRRCWTKPCGSRLSPAGCVQCPDATVNSIPSIMFCDVVFYIICHDVLYQFLCIAHVW